MFFKIDLHGVKHSDVIWLVIKEIERLWNTGSTLDIITGDSHKMKSIVIDILEEYNLDYQEGDILKVNTGFIRVFNI